MINLINQGLGGGGQVSLGGGSRSTEAALPLPVNTAPQVALPQPAPAQEAQVLNDQAIHDAMQERTNALRQSIAEALPRFFMPVSDVRFTIYKDSSGQYITRFTNIVSGETSQIPEPNLLQMLSSGGGFGSANRIQTSA